MLLLQKPDMDMRKKTPILVFLIVFLSHVSGQLVPQPKELQIDIMDGEVIVIWQHPTDAPSSPKYNVQMGKYTGEWNEVPSCTGITQTHCDLSSSIEDYNSGYKVKVQLVTHAGASAWTMKKFLPNTSKLQPPSFSLFATSSTLSVQVHQKPILNKLFPFGPMYTIYLEERGPYEKKTTTYLDEDQKATTFSNLRWGTDYCVSIKVEGKGTLSSSSVSNPKCLNLPEREWFIIAVTSLSFLGVVALAIIVATILLCYLRRPEKTPSVLKSPTSGWRPLSVREATMEIVTDKGWFLSTYTTQVESGVQDPVTHVTVQEDNGEEDRRTSMDSGVSMESNSTTNSSGNAPLRQDDSGCGSLGEAESSTSSQTDYPLQERTDADVASKREDSGVGLGCQLQSSSTNLDGQDGGTLREAVAGGNYCSQSPSAVQIHVCDEEETFKERLPDCVLAEVVTGYRAGPQSCICSGAGQCTWCHTQGLYGAEVIKQYRAVCIDNGLLSSTRDFVDSYKGITFSSYSKTTKMDTVTMNDFENDIVKVIPQMTFEHLGETFPLLTALTPLPLVEEGQDLNMNNVSLSLCDVQLTHCGM